MRREGQVLGQGGTGREGYTRKGKNWKREVLGQGQDRYWDRDAPRTGQVPGREEILARG